jgi:hypothetical protein
MSFFTPRASNPQETIGISSELFSEFCFPYYEDAGAKEIRDTLAAVRGVQTELVIGDVYTVHGDLENARKSVRIAREQVDRAG